MVTALIDGSHYVVGNVSEFVTMCLDFVHNRAFLLQAKRYKGEFRNLL